MSTPLECTAHIGNIMTNITGDVPVEFWDALSFKMSYEVPGAQFSGVYRKGHWDGRKKLFNKRWLAFPTGLFNLFRETCDEFDIIYKVEDTRQVPNLGVPMILKNIQLRDYQIEAVETAFLKQRGMIRSATGSGKTEMIAGLLAKTNIPSLILIHKQDIFHQLVDRLGNRLGVPIGEIGCGKVYPQEITVGMIQTIHRAYGGTLRGLKDIDKDATTIPKPEIIKQFVNRVECVIIDECHHVAASIFGKVLSTCDKAYYRWGFSASPWREDNADLLLDAHTGAKCVDISATELINRGYLAKPTIYLYEYDHGRPSAFGYPHMYEQQVVKNTFRNKIVGFASGQLSSTERRKILKDLNNKKINIAIATTVFGEGIDCPSLDMLINAKANKSAIDSLQLVGRALRKTKTKDKVTVVDIYDNHCKYLGKHAKDRLRMYRTEPGFIIKRITKPEEIVFL